MDHGVNLQRRDMLLAAVRHGYLELARYMLTCGITSENDQSVDKSEALVLTPYIHQCPKVRSERYSFF